MDFVRSLGVTTINSINKGAYSNIELNKVIRQNKEKLSNTDISFLTNLVYGVLDNKLLLDYIILSLVGNKFKKLESKVLIILEMGAYQILFMDKIPKSAAVNTSCELAKKYANIGASKLVNAVLRKINKDMLDIENLKEENFEKYISIKYSLPNEIIELLKQDYSLEQIEEFAKVYNLKKDIGIRVNNLKTNILKIEDLLKKENIAFEKTNFKDFLELKNVKQLDNLSIFKEGNISVQDKIASLPALFGAYLIKKEEKEEKEKETEDLTQEQAEEQAEEQAKDITILDVCSAPGGKATYLCELTEDRYKIYAADIHKHRVELIKQNVKRLGLKNVYPILRDGLANNNDKEEYNLVILDVPCMGLGVIRSKKDIKYSKNKENVKDLNKLQKELLDINSKCVKKGRYIIYSTCSILKCENQDIVDNFLEQNKDFEQIKITSKLLENLNLENLDCFIKQGFLQVLPTKDTEGFFVGIIKRN